MSPARRKDGEGELLGQLDQLAERIERGELRAPKKIVEAMRAIASSQQAIPAKRGRPKGAKTKGDTPGVKLAREYLDLLCDGLRPMAAAREAARRLGRPNMDETTALHALNRHHDRLIDEAESDAKEAEREYYEHISGLCDVEQAIAAMTKSRAWLAEVLGDPVSRREIADRIAKLETETEIRAVLVGYAQTVLQELRRRAAEEVARILAEEPTSTIFPDIPNGGLEYWLAFLKAFSDSESVAT